MFARLSATAEMSLLQVLQRRIYMLKFAQNVILFIPDSRELLPLAVRLISSTADTVLSRTKFKEDESKVAIAERCVIICGEKFPRSVRGILCGNLIFLGGIYEIFRHRRTGGVRRSYDAKR